MGCCTSTLVDDNLYEPSPFAMSVALPAVKYNSRSFANYEIQKSPAPKVLVVCTDDGHFVTAQGKVFNSGHNVTEMYLPLLHFTDGGFDVEFATESGSAVVIEEWGMPKSAEQRKSGLPSSEDELILKLHKELRPKMLAPLQLANVDIEQYVGLFLPGGHGAMVNLPDSVDLGKLLIKAHEMELPTVALCHGPAALLSAAKVEGAEFPYTGYRAVTFSDKTDGASPSIGYLPGQMPWYVQESLREKGMIITNTSETGATLVHKELITGDSPHASDNIGYLGMTKMIEFEIARVRAATVA